MPNPVTFAKLDVINQALTGLGEDRCGALTDDFPRMVVMREHYDAVLQACHSKSNWRFATSKAALNKLTAVPTNRWAAQWQLPLDLVKLISTWPPSDYERQGNRILTNEGTRLEIDYVRLVAEGDWPSWFTEYVVARLVVKTCYGIKRSAADKEMLDEADRALRDARFEDAQQQPNATFQTNDFIDVRR
jgi:hypothetical protein